MQSNHHAQEVYRMQSGPFCVYVYLIPQSCPTLCDPMDYSQPGSSVHGILKARILEWVAISYSRWSSWPMDRIHISCVLHWQADSLSLVRRGKPHKIAWKKKSQLLDCIRLVGLFATPWTNPPCSSVHGISQARLLEWVAILFFRGSSWPGYWTQVSCIAGGVFTFWATREA